MKRIERTMKSYWKLPKIVVVFFVVIGALAAVAAVTEYNSPVIEVTTNTDVYGAEYAIVEYEHGTIGAKALTDEDGVITILTCYQKFEDETSRCWSKTMDNVE